MSEYTSKKYRPNVGFIGCLGFFFKSVRDYLTQLETEVHEDLLISFYDI